MDKDVEVSKSSGTIRNILGVILGYAAMVVVVVFGMYVAWMILGPEGAFDGESTTASGTWSAINCLGGAIAAFVGGVVTGLVGHNKKLTVFCLAGLVVALGFTVAAFMTFNTEVVALPDGKKIADLTFSEAGQVARSPDWYNYVIPLIGAFGILAGGHLVGGKKKAA